MSQNNDKEKPAGSQSLFRGLMLIEILSNYPNGCPLAHLSELAGLNKSTVHRLLQGLQSCGYVTPAPAAGSYRLTTKFIAVGQKALSSLNIIHVAAPHLEALNLATGETVNFSSREDDHAILIYKLEPTTGMLVPTLASICRCTARRWGKFIWRLVSRIMWRLTGKAIKIRSSR